MTDAWQPAYVALGSNQQDPRAQVGRAFGALAGLPETRLLLRSRLYVTPPFGPVRQDDFVNAVAGLLTRLAPHDVLHHLRAIEAAQGRVRAERWGPRTLDLDLLVHGSSRIADDELKLPHPGIAERAFVLYPLADFAPHLVVPGLGRVADLVTRVDGAGIRALDA
jgi:2-amino-4-hydroxy-6-hydroxymethyldihydropteridine diphosphokinase